MVGRTGVVTADDDEVSGPCGARARCARKADLPPPFRVHAPVPDDFKKPDASSLHIRFGHVAIEGAQLADHRPTRHGIVEGRGDGSDTQADESRGEGIGQVACEFEAAVAFGAFLNGDKQAGVGHVDLHLRTEKTAPRSLAP